MKLELEVLASTSIKRKKPWPRLAWIGESQESIYLFDDHRMSVLYIPSGKTKKKIPKLHRILADVTALNHSDNGIFVVGLLRSGDVFIFHKDTDTLKYLQGLNDLTFTLPNQSNNANRPNIPIEPPKPQIFIADDGAKVVVLMNRSKIYVWEQDSDQQFFAPKRIDVKGSWSQVKPSPTVPLPSPSARECSTGAVFFIHDVLGLCCSISFVFTIDQSVNITTSIIRWFGAQNLVTYSTPTFFIEWTNVKYPLENITKGGSPVRALGAYLCCPSHDGQIVAAAINQRTSHSNKMIFVSPLTDVFVVADLKGSGARLPSSSNFKTYWVTDLAWTADDLFLVAMTSQGSVSILTRLGEPLLLKTFGCSIEMGPRYYLPLHPVISVQKHSDDVDGDIPEEAGSSSGSQDPMRQRFSVSCHPREPIILCSDGYMVTALQLPTDMTCLSLMKGLVMESNGHLRRIRDSQKINLTLYDSMRRQGRVTKKFSLSGGVAGGRRVPKITTKPMVSGGSPRAYRFEEPDEDALNNTLDDDDTALTSDVFTGNMESGKIFFGDVDHMNNSVDVDMNASAIQEAMSVVQLLEHAKSTLLLAWGLAASHSGLWTEEHEEVATNIAHNMVKLFSVIMHCSAEVINDLEALQAYHLKKCVYVKNHSLVIILTTVKSILRLLHLDAPYQHLMVCAVRFAHSTLKMFLTDSSLAKREPKLNTLHGCFALLKVFESSILSVYTSLPKNGIQNGMDPHLQQEFSSVFEPATVSLFKNRRTSIVTDVTPGFELHGEAPNQRKLIRAKPGEEEQEEMRNAPTYTSDIDRRLVPVWRLLYKHIVAFYTTQRTQNSKATLDGPLLELLMTVQMKLTKLGQTSVLSPKKKTKVKAGDRLSIEGCSVPALKAWMYQLNITQGQSTACSLSQRFLLSTLYSLLLQDELRAAIELTELLLKLPDLKSAISACRQDQATKWSILAKLYTEPRNEATEPPRHIQNEAVESVVKSVARIMAAYFSNQTLFVFPPHAPRVIPPLHKKYKLEHRLIPLYHESLANVIRTDGLDGVWTVERAMEYLLLAGLLPEAVWLANTLGDWKTAFIIGVAQLEQNQKQPKPENKNEDQLPKSLHPETLLQSKLAQSFGLNTSDKGILLIDEESDMPQLRRSLHDLMLAATLSRIDLVPWLLEGLVAELKYVCKQFTALVPSGLYLPAPPVYCPQPANTSQAGLCEDALIEVALRHQASSLIQLVFLVMEGSNCTLPAARWYAKRVQAAGRLGKKFKTLSFTLEEVDIAVLQESYLDKDSSFTGKETDPSIHRILAAYRDFSSLVWMLYVRDKLSLGLRKKIQLIDRKMHKSPVPTETWLKHCRDTLDWATHLVPFAHFLQAENDVFGITLSLITELPTDAHTCSLLSLFFHDAESMDPEIQDKLQAVLKDWQGVFLDAAQTPRGTKIPRGTSMSFYFHKQSQRMEKYYRKKAKVFGEYEVFVFNSEESEEKEREECGKVSNGINCIGSRPFESTGAFLSFLDVFYAVSFHKLIDAEEVSPLQMPLLSANSFKYRKKELTSFAHKAVTSLHKKQSSSDVPTSPQTSQPDLSVVTNIAPSSRPPASPRGKIGLFRSRSFSEISSKRGHLPPRSPSVERRKSSSHHDLRSLDDDRGFLALHTTKPGTSSKPSPQGSLLRTQTQRITSGSDTLLMVDGIVPKMSLTRKCEIRRSASVNDVDQARKDKEKTQNTLPQVDPLSKPVMTAAVLDRLNFGRKYIEVEQLLEWLSRWSARNHNLSSKTEHQVISGQTSLYSSMVNLSSTGQGSPFKTGEFNKSFRDIGTQPSGTIKPAMRIRVQPRLLVYSLWLIQNHYNNKQQDNADPAREVSEQANSTTFSGTGTLTMGTGRDTSAFTNSQTQVFPQSVQHQQPGKSTDLASEENPENPLPELSFLKDDSVDADITDVQSEWFDHQELESSYIAQILSAESNESISDGYIPRPKKKMGILKKKKDKKKKDKKADDEGQSTPSVGTAETLLRRHTFKEGGKRSQDSATVQAHQAQNNSQVSDSSLSVSSLNEEEMEDPLRQTMRHLNHGPGMASQKEEPGTSGPVSVMRGSNDKVPLLSNMSKSIPDTRLDLGQLEGPARNGDDPEDLRHIVRQELRKIVDAQHRGIMAMLGALGEEEDIPIGTSTPHEISSLQKEKKSKGKKKSRRTEVRQEGNVMNTTRETSFNDRSSLTEVDVTPLPSDEMSLKSTNDHPMTGSELFGSKTWSPGSRFAYRQVGTNVRGALRELKLLENSQSPNPNHVHFDLQGEARAVPAKDGKENVTQQLTNQAGPSYLFKGPGQSIGYQGHPSSQMQNGQGHMNLHNHLPDTNQPFARVFEMLKAFNHSITPNGTGASQTGVGTEESHQHQAQGMPLLHMNTEPTRPSLRFPPVPVPPPGPPGQVRGVPPGDVPRMPLLHLYTPHHKDEVPVREMNLRFPPHPHSTQVQGGPSAPPRMALLKLQQPQHERVFQHIEDERGDLHLVPAEDLQAYEARLQLEKEKKLEQRRKQMEALGLSAPPDEAVKKQQRNQNQSDKRRQRRLRLETEDNFGDSTDAGTSVKFQAETRELETTSQYVQADPMTSTQEVQVNYTPTPRELMSRGAQYPTPREVEEEEEEELPQEQPESQLHHGYALTPGLFDEYLTKDSEMGTALDNAARIQYQAASALQPRRLKEVGTETDGPGWTEQSTVISRDQGTDPVTEAIEAYNRAKQGLSAQGLLAPDVFMGLKFSETPAETTNEEDARAKRAFINVVDLEGATLDDIVSSVRDRESRSAREPSRIKTPRERRTPSPEKSPERSRVYYEDEVEDRPIGPDRVTRRTLGHRSPDRSLRDSREWDSAIVQSARSQAKGAIRQRLENMEAQFGAIDAMSRNIEEDYRNARLMIHTIEQIGEAIQPTRLSEDSDQQDRITPRGSPKRSPQKQSQIRFSEREPDKPSPIPEVSDEGRSTARSQLRTSRDTTGLDEISSEQPVVDTKLDLTGLSGVSDIIGEVIASGKVDASELGLSERQSQRLAEKAVSARDRSGLDDLMRSGEMHKEQDAKSRQRTEKERAELRAWMEEKKRKHMEDFRRRQQELREREHDPYKGADDTVQMSTLTMRELEEFEQKRVQAKKQRELEYAEKRRSEASQLMGDMLTDRPELPKPLPVHEPTRNRPSSGSPVRKEKTALPARKKTSQSPARKDTSPLRGARQRTAPQRQAWESDPDRVNVQMDDLRNIRDSSDYDRQFRHTGEQLLVETGRKSGLMSGSGFLNTQTGTSSAGLRAYTQHLEHVQSSYEPDSGANNTLKADTTQEFDKSEAKTVPLHKPKPFSKIVKMQRPEITRQERLRPRAKPYVERLSDISQTEDTPRSESKEAILAKQRLYGTKRLPGTQTVRTAPRNVKTYQERLREMKQARQKNPAPIRRYTGPIRANGSTFTRPVAHSATKKVKRPAKKPMTYQDQLRALQPPKELYRTGTLNASSTLERSRPRKRKGPAHKPLTYSQQLQALQPPKELYRTGTLEYPEVYQEYDHSAAAKSQVYRSPQQNALRRSGPYPNPYTPDQYDPEEDRASVVSAWSVDDDVRRLIYDGASSVNVGDSAAGTELDVSELRDLAGVSSEAPDYADLVDIREIADAASVSEGSIMSFIDWDQVNDLIADVY